MRFFLALALLSSIPQGNALGRKEEEGGGEWPKDLGAAALTLPRSVERAEVEEGSRVTAWARRWQAGKQMGHVTPIWVAVRSPTVFNNILRSLTSLLTTSPWQSLVKTPINPRPANDDPCGPSRYHFYVFWYSFIQFSCNTAHKTAC